MYNNTAYQNTVSCRDCHQTVSLNAISCPHCGAPKPADKTWNGSGFEYKSQTSLFGLPLIHVATGRDKNNKRRVAKGIIAIGQFGKGIITIAQFGYGFICISQFGIGVITISQFGLGLAVLAQFGLGLIALAQMAIVFLAGKGLLILNLGELIRRLLQG